jgi:hypothetical protein
MLGSARSGGTVLGCAGRTSGVGRVGARAWGRSVGHVEFGWSVGPLGLDDGSDPSH